MSEHRDLAAGADHDVGDRNSSAAIDVVDHLRGEFLGVIAQQRTRLDDLRIAFVSDTLTELGVAPDRARARGKHT